MSLWPESVYIHRGNHEEPIPDNPRLTTFFPLEIELGAGKVQPFPQLIHVIRVNSKMFGCLLVGQSSILVPLHFFFGRLAVDTRELPESSGRHWFLGIRENRLCNQVYAPSLGEIPQLFFPKKMSIPCPGSTPQHGLPLWRLLWRGCNLSNGPSRNGFLRSHGSHTAGLCSRDGGIAIVVDQECHLAWFQKLWPFSCNAIAGHLLMK